MTPTSAAASIERRRSNGVFDPLGSAERRKLRLQTLGSHLRDPLRPVDVLQPEEPEVAQEDVRGQVVLHQLARRRRQEHLTAVRDAADPRRAVNGEADVAFAGRVRLTGVDPDADTHRGAIGPRMIGERALDRDGRRDRVRRAAERDEERVALGVYLLAVVGRERLAHETLLIGQELAVALPPKAFEELGRALDVGE